MEEGSSKLNKKTSSSELSPAYGIFVHLNGRNTAISIKRIIIRVLSQPDNNSDLKVVTYFNTIWTTTDLSLKDVYIVKI